MEYKYLVSVDKADIWERHSEIKYIGLFNSLNDANCYIKIQKDFDRYSITKIPAIPKEAKTYKNYAEFGNRMIYNLKTKEITIGTRRLFAVSEFIKPVFYNNYSSKLYDVSIVISKKSFTADAIGLIENQKIRLLADQLKYLNDMLFRFKENNLITFEYGSAMKIYASIVGKPETNVQIVNPFRSFSFMLVGQEQKAYEANPTPERLEQAFYKIMDKLS
jgi:hypothetical protein